MKNKINRFDIIKGLSIISVVIAHSVGEISRTMSIFQYVFNNALNVLGFIGVPNFFFISGYFFAKDKSPNIRAFFQKKINTIFLPWVFCGSIIYIVTSLCGSAKEDISIFKWMKYILGYKSLYYYLSVLTILFLTFKVFEKLNLNKKLVLSISLVLSLSTIAFYSISSDYFLNKYIYINPLSWIFFFALGHYFSSKEEGLHNHIEYFSDWIKGLFTVFFVFSIICIVDYMYNPWISYFRFSAFFMECSAITLFYILASFIENRYIEYPQNKIVFIFDHLGKISFTTYLLHLPVCMGLVLLLSKLELMIFPFNLIAGFITLGIMTIVIARIRTVNIGFVKVLIGLRD